MHKKFVGKLKGRELGRPRHKWKNNIRMDLRGIGWEVVDWTYLADDSEQWRTPLNTKMNFRFL